MQVNKSVLTEGKNKGHKRHILTDTFGCLLAVKVHRANLHDTKAGIFPTVKAFPYYPTSADALLLQMWKLFWA
jgi:hypothetical protein